MKNKTGLPTGTYVTRSTYQKVVEENKSLLSDIYNLVMTKRGNEVSEALFFSTFEKWHDKFKQDAEFKVLMKHVAIEYLKEHPELDITKKATNTPN